MAKDARRKSSGDHRLYARHRNYHQDAIRAPAIIGHFFSPALPATAHHCGGKILSAKYCVPRVSTAIPMHQFGFRMFSRCAWNSSSRYAIRLGMGLRRYFPAIHSEIAPASRARSLSLARRKLMRERMRSIIHEDGFEQQQRERDPI